MNAHRIIRENDLAAWELAEAEAHERAARALRLKAVRRLAAVQAEIKAACEVAIQRRNA